MTDGSNVDELPFVTPELPGVGGRLRTTPEHFIVDELPLYEPSGEGEHVYVRLTKVGMTTAKVRDGLSELFEVPIVDIGYAGLKDKHARAAQTFSIRSAKLDQDLVAARVESELGLEVQWVKRHGNKLRPGHLAGNRFRIVVTEIEELQEAVGRASTIVSAIEQRGLPNFYGSQRFGIDRDNAKKGRDALTGRAPRDHFLRRLLFSSYQSALFNLYLKERMDRGWFYRLLVGDVAKKLDTGGLFDVVDEFAETERYRRHEITFTGPIYGASMRPAAGEPGRLEDEIASGEHLTPEKFKRARLEGSRRPGRIHPKEMKVATSPEGLVVDFVLPKGAYATVLLREVMKRTTDDEVDEWIEE